MWVVYMVNSLVEGCVVVIIGYSYPAGLLVLFLALAADVVLMVAAYRCVAIVEADHHRTITSI
jgi:hypothetical protein